MKKKTILFVSIIIIIILVIIGAFLIIRTVNKVKDNCISIKGNIFRNIEEILDNMDLTYDILTVNSVNFGAKEGYRYSISDGTIFEIYKFEDGKKCYNDIVSSGEMYILGTKVKYDVDVIEKANIAIYYKNEGKNISKIKSALK